MNTTEPPHDESVIRPPVCVAQWLGDAHAGHLRLLDQTKLPVETTFIDCKDTPAVWDAIKRLVVRGRQLSAVAASYGLVIGAQEAQESDFIAGVEKAAAYLGGSRPTAVNLNWALQRVLQRAKSTQGSPAEIRSAMLDEARAIHGEDEAMCMAIGRHAADIIGELDVDAILTHCNAGALATGGVGTATAGMYVAHAAGQSFKVYCDETRPLLQGSRLTAWELSQAGIEAVVITDNMAGHVMKEGLVQLVITGADRIAANGDSANKIGTYSVAVLAARHNIPFYIAAPYSTFDMELADGDAIPIELRGGEEITNGFGRRTRPEGIATYCPAFDVTPAELIKGIITDRGIITPVTTENIRKVIAG